MYYPQESRDELVWNHAGFPAKHEWNGSFSWIQHNDHPRTRAIQEWFCERGLRLDEDFTRAIHKFTDPKHAMLFKLTFG